MGTTVVRYKTKPERAEENQQLVEAVFAELAQIAPEGLTYASYRLADGVSFVHVASMHTTKGDNPLAAIAAFTTFLHDIADRCIEAPIAMEATTIGTYTATAPSTAS
jgi:hypothetical protein